jgi:hypothetical protein
LATTHTRTATETSTLTKVVYVTRKVQADLFGLVDTYSQITPEYARRLIHDLRLFLDEEVIQRIELVWTKTGTNEVVGAYVYEVIAAGIGLADDRSGGIRYDDALAGAAFAVRITRNARWAAMTDEERGAIEAECEFRWGPAGYLDFSRGAWVSERTYSKEGYGLGRHRFTGW